MFVTMGLRWTQSDEHWWRGVDDTGRDVASAQHTWYEDHWAWQARWWGDRDPATIGLSFGRDTTIVADDLDDPAAAMAAVDAHIATRAT